jgi:hypothetical protein
MIKKLLIACIAAAFTCPASAADEYGKVHTVAIVSTVGTNLILKRIGIMVFGNSETTVSPAQWKIDDLIAQKMTEALSPHYRVLPVTFDSAKLEKCWDWEKCVAMLPPNPSVDVYIFVKEAEIYMRGGNLDPHGFGIYRTQVPFSDDMNMLHVLYRVDVVDARTGDEIDHGTARLSDTVSLGEHMPPTMPLNPPMLPNSDSQLSDAQLDLLRPMIVNLIQRSYVHALMNANLLPEGADANLTELVPTH